MTAHTIYKIEHKINYVKLGNNLVSSTLDPVAKAILSYLLSKPIDWKLKVNDLKKTLGLTAYKAKKGIKILKAFGYLTLKRLTSGHTIWRVFETPQPIQNIIISPSVDLRQVENEPVLIKTESVQKKELLPDIPPPIPNNQQNVVVKELDGLKESQRRAANKLLNEIDTGQLAVIMAVFSQAMKKGKVGNQIGYLHSLVKAAKEGTLTHIEQKNKAITYTELRDKEEKRLKSTLLAKIDNITWARKMKEQYGEKFKA